jgi:hypothetical protein
MTQPLLESLPPFMDAIDNPEIPLLIGAREARDDMSLCFLCMRWSAGDPDCSAGKRCDYQITLDHLN